MSEALQNIHRRELFEITKERRIELAHRMSVTKERRRFLITGQGYVGWAPRCTRNGDKIFVLLGCGTPVILRPHGDAYKLIGECYVHGIMYDKVIDDLEEGKHQLQDVTIV